MTIAQQNVSKIPRTIILIVFAKSAAGVESQCQCEEAQMSMIFVVDFQQYLLSLESSRRD